MIRTAAVAALLAGATSAQAQVEALVADVAGAGCTLLISEEEQYGGLVEGLLAGGQAERWGDYIVLSDVICEIEAPDLSDAPTIAGPRFESMIVPDVTQDGTPLWRMGDWIPVLRALYGDEDAATRAYISILGRGFLDGTLAFFKDDLLETPATIEILTGGACRRPGDVAGAEDDPAILAARFGSYLRGVGAATHCRDATTATMLSQPEFAPDSRNAWIFFQFDMVAAAAGYVEGITATERGEPRPPLCHL